MTDRIVIAGGGASGMLVARALLEQSPTAHVRIYEPRALGAGSAYSTRCPSHLLNVPAERISAFPDAPDHFMRYLERRNPGVYGDRAFVARSTYGDYLAAIASETLARFAARVTHVRSTLDDIAVDADVVVLATGNESPAPLPPLARASRVIDDPWNARDLSAIPRNARIAIAGSGLTAIDVLLALRANGHDAPIRFFSRNGRLPHEHRDDFATIAPIDTASLRTALRSLRRSGKHWRAAVDELRPFTNTSWQRLTMRERAQFLRYLAPIWNIHRHRVAPEVALRLAYEMANNTLSLHRSSIAAAEERGELDGAIVVNATGPNQQLARTRNPLLRNLLQRGTIVPGPFGMGVAVDESGAALDAHRMPLPRLFAIGPLRSGTLLETTAIPEIRAQAVTLASHITTTFEPRISASFTSAR